ncbi:hypothetical protein CVT25_007560 [Psilocybe cyanescens]|uniref:Uncharacterized protein n=1 Tax=Psilocybe cyanescens TaxID=93625 RepID=A0A409WVV1_PSICY|nr:hypothetical protein CVT25_007560 [Psilocybe cyanescens]
MTAVNTQSVALQIQPKTENKLLLLSALRESEGFCHWLEVHAFELQASNILNEAYASCLKNQLAMKEEKKMKKKATKLVGDGLPRLLTADTFYKLAKEKEKKVREEAQQKSKRVEARKLYDEAVAQWKKNDEVRKVEAAEVKTKNVKAKEVYEKKKAQAKEKGKVFKGAKPTILPIPKAIPKPKLKDFVDGRTNVTLEAGGDDGEVFEGLEEEGGKDEDKDKDNSA